MKKISRAEAQRQGLKRYFTGKPCKHGHVSKRVTVNGDCYECLKLRMKIRRQQKAELLNEQHRQRYADDPQSYLERAERWRCANPEKRRAIAAAWARRNPQATAKRRAAKLQRTPPWADLKAIEAFYKACPKGHHVDHYYPLQGGICSGLHVLENLRHIPAKENISKGNKMPEDFYRLLT